MIYLISYKDSGVVDFIGAFAVSAGFGSEELCRFFGFFSETFFILFESLFSYFFIIFLMARSDHASTINAQGI